MSSNPVLNTCRRFNDSKLFHNAVLFMIVLTAIIMGIETNAELLKKHYALFHLINMLLQVFFVAELAIRMTSHAPRVQNFFRDGWNVFDFAVVVCSLLPAAGPFAMVARLARLLRVARLLSAVPELRLLVATMLRSIPSMSSIFLLLGVILYVYAVTGIHLFRDADPERWGGLGRALMTLFQVLTLESWIEVMNDSATKTPFAWVYYISFIVLAVFVVVNLFIAVVINNLEGAKEAHKIATSKHEPAMKTIREIREKLAELELQLDRERHPPQ